VSVEDKVLHATEAYSSLDLRKLKCSTRRLSIIIIMINKNLSIEIQRMWNMKCLVMPVIIGTTGIVTKGLKHICKRYLEDIQ
jgi:hypothetical protein